MTRAQRFLEAFAAATHDRELEESGCEIYHFFDSDFLSRVIFGFRDTLNHRLIVDSKSGDDDSLAGQRLLMAAFVGARIGAPPLMRSLPPHLYEVQMAVARTSAGGNERENQRLTLDLLELSPVLRELRRHLAADEVDVVFERFLELGPPIFYGVEMLSGHWETRLRRLLSMGIHEESPFDFFASESALGSAFHVLGEHVGHVGLGSGEGSIARGLRDTMALAMLARDVAHAPTDEPPARLARFYTETPRILNAWRSSNDVRELLTYGQPTLTRAALDVSVNGVLRTADYYLIRALIPELAYPASGDAKETVAPSSVYAIGEQLREIFAALRKGGLSEAAMASVRVGRGTLGDYVNELTDISSFGTTWRRFLGDVPRGLPKTLIGELQDVAVEQRRLAPELKDSFERQVQSLTSRTRDIKAFTDAYVHVKAVLGRARLGRGTDAGELARQLGMERWGFRQEDVSEEMVRRLGGEYGAWASARSQESSASAHAESSHLHSFVSEIAYRLNRIGTTPVTEPERMGDAIALLAFLWKLNDMPSVHNYGFVLLEVLEWRLGGKEPRSRKGAGKGRKDLRLVRVGGALENMSVAAGIRAEVQVCATGVAAQRQEREVVASAERAVVELAEGNRRFPADEGSREITQGDILFHAWQHVNQAAIAWTAVEPERARRKRLAKRSFEIGASALEQCDQRSPLYPLLLNHCLYVGAVTGLAVEEAARESDLARQLMVQQSSGSHPWLYQFDDTLGFYFYARAARAVAALRRGAAEIWEMAEGAQKDMSEAERWFARVPPDASDSDVLTHRGLLRELEEELRRLVVHREKATQEGA